MQFLSKAITRFYRPGIDKSMSTLTVLTWNVWFDKFRQVERNSAIFSHCLSLQPDVICFQEVTPSFVELMQSSGLLDLYDCSINGHERSVIPYGVMSLAKKSMSASFSFHKFESKMYRQLLVTSFCAGGQSFAVGNVHLESLNSRPRRTAQLHVSGEVLRQYDNYLLCGDFNFCSYQNYGGSTEDLENDTLRQILPDMGDLWEVIHGQDNAFYTFNGQENRLVADRDELMRYDRICFHFKDNGVSGPTMLPSSVVNMNQPIVDKDGSPVKVEAIGGSYNLYPSDHYGILGHFTVPSLEQES